MHRQKRRIHCLCALALTAALALQPVLAVGPEIPADYRSPFSDVQEGQWFYPFVASLNSRGVTAGYGDGRFGPYDPTGAGDAMIMVLKAAGCGEQTPLQDTHYATGYANYAVSQGWLTWEQIPELGSAASRLFVARLAAQALGLAPVNTESPFADVSDGLVTALYQKGIVAGNQEGERLTFHPDASITRAELSTIVWRVQDYASHIHFGSYTLDILPEVPVCSYDPAAFALEGDRMTYTAAGVKTALGVDVSAHQGEIDWEAAARDGIQFAMIRAGGRYYGSGVIFEDTWFRRNIEGARAAGLETGVYFFSQAVSVEEAREEARFLLDLLEDYAITGPVVFDWENITYDTARTDGVDSATVTAAADAFCQLVEKAGYQPMIYFNQYIAYLLYDLEGVAQYPFWLAQYGQLPGFYYDFQMWQYTDSGQVKGINGPADLNIRFLPW